jgi:hypothetical protein
MPIFYGEILWRFLCIFPLGNCFNGAFKVQGRVHRDAREHYDVIGRKSESERTDWSVISRAAL